MTITVETYNPICTNFHGENKCTAILNLDDITLAQAITLVKHLSIELESAEFDKRCYEFFKTVCEE